jgi:hypothetical protein
MRAGGAPVPPAHWKRQPLLLRFRIWLTYGLARLMISFYGFESYR